MSTPAGTSLGSHYLADTLLQLQKLKGLAEKAISQINDAQMFAALDSGSNSIAIIMTHIAGNMRSRWTDFLTSDGEKPDRERDTEFERAASENKIRIMMLWEDGWRRTLDSISSLGEADLMKIVAIRGEPHTVVEAINRQVSHYSMHVGQIVFLAKHLAGGNWNSLSIPRGQSKTFDVSKRGSRYTVAENSSDGERQQ